MKTESALWAVNPFEKEVKATDAVVRLAELLRSKCGWKFLPAYVASPYELQMSLEFSSPMAKRFEFMAEQAMHTYMQKVGWDRDCPTVVVSDTEPSLRSNVKALIQLSKKNRSRVILAATHGRKGIERFMLGSFAETLMHLSAVPLVLVNPRSKPNPAIRKIIFCTDFSAVSKKAFKHLLPLAKNLGAKVEILHVFKDVPPWTQVSVDPWLPQALLYYPDMPKVQEKRLNHSGRKWVQEAKRYKVPASFHLAKAQKEVAKEILNYATKSKAQMLAMAIESGPVTANVIGSTTRKVVREASVPVWLYPKN